LLKTNRLSGSILLTNDHFKAIHLPEASHACVFEVTFLDQIAALTTDKHARLVLYGASEKSMDAIENKSLNGDKSQPVLISHLKSDDFFFTRVFSTATFTIQSGTPRNKPYVSAPNVDVQGELYLSGIKAGFSFPATVYQALDGTITAKARFDLDRTHWNIIYGSNCPDSTLAWSIHGTVL
jgi:hypothetical protein